MRSRWSGATKQPTTGEQRVPNTFSLAANHLKQVQEQIPFEVRAVMKAAAVEVQTLATAQIRSGATPKEVGVRYDGPKMFGDKVQVEFRPVYIARWLEGGTQPHRIARGERTRGRRGKQAMRSAFRAQKSAGKIETMLASGRDAKGQTLTARRRAGLEARRQKTMVRGAEHLDRGQRIFSGEEYIGAVAIGKGKHGGDVTPSAKPNSNFAASVQHPGTKAKHPIRNSIVVASPSLASQLAQQVNKTWATINGGK